MGFEHIPLTSCYLGLPMFRSQKVRDFNFLVKCLDSKLAGWKAWLFSKAGRLTLIKLMDARIRRFWWGSNDTNPRPLCLKAWDDICVPKDDGGLGFRRMVDMNLALLSKWGWDFQTRSSSKCLSFLQSKYLRTEGFRTTTPTHSDSPFWKAILGSKDLLLKGACIQIGVGSSVNIWENPWVPNYQDFKPKPRRPHQGDCRVVKELIARLGVWDTSKVRDLFDLVDANTFLALSLPFQPGKDKWIWTPAKLGKFSSRSAYLTTQCHCFHTASSIPRMV
ncbi:hypothetical protein UlMin_009584 [Ulmus minor]